MSRNALARSSLAAFTAWGLCAAACNDADPLPRGQLIVALSSDMSVTKDLDEVRVQVFRADGTSLPDRQIPILPAEPAPFGKPLPGTLAIVPADAGGQQLRVVVTARRLDPKTGNKESRVVREAIVKMPTDRTALLSMPLRWLCTDKVAKVEGSEDSFRSDCAENETCVAGSCQPADVDADALPDYVPASVFGGGNETGENSQCLDVAECFAGSAIISPDAADCSVALPNGADRDRLNVALVLDPESDGHCVDRGNCYLPLDADPDEGFRIERGKIVLPPVACERQGVLGVAISTACPTKDLSIPVCGPWTGWPRRGMTGGAGAATGPSGGNAGKGGDAGKGGSTGAAFGGAPGTAGTGVSFGGKASAGSSSTTGGFGNAAIGGDGPAPVGGTKGTAGSTSVPIGGAASAPEGGAGVAGAP